MHCHCSDGKNTVTVNELGCGFFKAAQPTQLSGVKPVGADGDKSAVRLDGGERDSILGSPAAEAWPYHRARRAVDVGQGQSGQENENVKRLSPGNWSSQYNGRLSSAAVRAKPVSSRIMERAR